MSVGTVQVLSRARDDVMSLSLSLFTRESTTNISAPHLQPTDSRGAMETRPAPGRRGGDLYAR